MITKDKLHRIKISDKTFPIYIDTIPTGYYGNVDYLLKDTKTNATIARMTEAEYIDRIKYLKKAIY